MWSVLEALFDGPVDHHGYASQPVILQKLPSFADGDASLSPVEILPGDEVIDAEGNLVTLAEGVKVYPSGCSSADCAIVSDGQAPIQMDQMSVTFKLLPDLKWSDGQPLTAQDSLFSYNLAASADTPASKYYIDRTTSYEAPDDQTTQWVGKPGFVDLLFADRFWIPLPEHAWGELTPTELLQSELSTRQPIGWGPYELVEWVSGDHISMRKNPNYFRAAEGLPYFDNLVFRFLGDNSDANIASLQAGECDILDQTTFLDERIRQLVELGLNKAIQPVFSNGPEWEHLDFGVRPASYDDGYNPASGDRMDIFGDARTRQAFALCLDRPRVNHDIFLDRAQIPLTYLPPEHPLYAADAPAYAYDPTAGSALLDETGWKDTDGNPATPRTAQGITNVPDGTPLTVTYWTTGAAQRKQSSEILVSSLGGCGIQVNLQHRNPGDLFAAGPAGQVFGRAFDLVQFTWESSLLPQCNLFESGRIPTAQNQWIGTNVSGYTSEEFDAACQAALHALPGSQAALDNQRQAQAIFAADLPVIPLYTHLKAAATRLDLCGYTLDPSSRSSLWNLEAINYGTGCPQS